jgi:GAF domain-containing protein
MAQPRQDVVSEDVLPRQMPDYLSHLRSAAVEINSSIDYETTLKNVANVMVPQLSDWCAVDIIAENGALQRLAISHKDSKKIKIAQELSDKYPPDPNASQGSPRVIRTGEPMMANNITDDMLVQSAKSEEHLRLMRQLEFHSMLIYPIYWQGDVLGSITFVWTEHKNNYSLTDVAFVEVLSVIAGSAIANARLLAQTKHK